MRNREMARRRAAWIALGALAAAAVLAAPLAGAASKPKKKAKPKPAPKPKPTLLVNDSAGVGKVGDGRLSLDEAIRLANGSLAASALSPAERAQIKGAPGATSADIIRVALGKGAVITLPVAAPKHAAITRIVGNTGDTLDGGGVTLTEQEPTGIGLVVASSGFTVQDLMMTGFNEDLVVDQGGLDLHDITIRRVDLETAAMGSLVVGARSSNGHLRGLTVTDSKITGLGGFDGQPVALTAANTLGGRVDNSTLEDVLFANNDVSGGLESFYVYGIEANGGFGTNDVVRRVRIIGNYVHDPMDAGLKLDGVTGIVNAITNSGIEDVVIENNHVVANNWGIGVWAGEAFGGSSVTGAFVRNVTIRNNRIEGVAGKQTQCLILEAGRVDVAGTANGNIIDGVKIADNTMRDCGQSGITVHGGVALAGGVVTGNVARNIMISGNTVTNSPLGLVLRGALASAASYVNGGSTEAITVTNNHFNAVGTGIRLVGGEVSGPAVATENTLRDVTFSGNTISAATRCVALADAGNGALLNSNTVACPL